MTRYSLARFELLLAVSTVKQALSIVADLVAYAVHKHVPAVYGRCAVSPGIDTQRAVIAVKVAGVSVTFFVTPVVTRLFLAFVLNALLFLALEVQVVGVHYVLAGDTVSAAEYAAAVVRVVDLAILAGPLDRAIAGIVSHQILAHCLRLLTRIAQTLIARVNLAVGSRSAGWTMATVTHARVGNAAGTTILARFSVAVRTGELAVVAVVVGGADAGVSSFLSCADATVLTGRTVAEIDLDLAVAAHVTRLTVAVVVVHKLHAVLGARSSAWVGEALVNVTFASWPDETGQTLALEAADFVHTGAVVVAGVDHAVVHVDVADDT